MDSNIVLAFKVADSHGTLGFFIQKEEAELFASAYNREHNAWSRVPSLTARVEPIGDGKGRLYRAEQ